MKTFSTVDQIKNISGKIYVRWSKSIALDNKRGYSLRYGTQAESGLSCCSIDQSWEDWRILRQLDEYVFCGGSCWIITGEEVGRGGDNEELLANVKCLGKVNPELLKTNWRKMELEVEINKYQSALDRGEGDAIGRRIITNYVEKCKKELEKIA